MGIRDSELRGDGILNHKINAKKRKVKI